MTYIGHADISTTMIYVHHEPKHNAAARLDAVIDAELNPIAASDSVLLKPETQAYLIARA